MSDAPAPVPIEPARKGLFERASMVWMIPLIALVIALLVAWQSYASRGPLISVQFENGSGIVAGQTELRFRDVTVGVVEELSFAEGLEGVQAIIRLDTEMAPYVDNAAIFWVVRPEVSVQGVSGLDTVLSGIFIEGSWDNDPGPPRDSFRGLETAPLFRNGEGGLQLALRSTPGGSMTDNAPILFRGIEVGRVGPARISRSGTYAIAEAIIYEPHGKLITRSTRFWDTSGFSVSLGPSGAEVDFSSIATLIGGGLSFDTFVSGGAAVTDGTVFQVFADQTTARNSVFNASETDLLELRMIFEENVSGLSIGAPVEWSGLRIGSVESLSGIVDPDTFGDNQVRLDVVIAIQPARLGLQEVMTPERALSFLRDRVGEGLRARLASASLLTGGLKVELVEIEDAEPGEIIVATDAIAIMPTTASSVSDAAATVEGVFSRINSLPIEELLNSAIGFMQNAQALLTSEAVRAAPLEVQALVADLRGIVASDEVQNIPVSVNAALARIEGILAQIEQGQAVERIIGAIDAATQAAGSVGASVSGVPELIDNLSAVAAKAEAMPLEELTLQLTELLGSADAILGTPAAQDLPASLGAALRELNLTLSELREGGAVGNVNAALASAREAADAVALSSQDLPALVERITLVVDQASRTIEGYNKGDVISRDAQAALRDISQAADALTSLLRLLERNPSALIRGR
ncbi:MlaD family protein [uncultured Roseobacter sp.]|uniref:PqiB family protein n=1 Tax=uncultured Roseobacter sp. TaxID=114847 RepID=UPI002602C29D|nr:MlaD family protein [uncultured Roseobacter sp.]